MDPKAKAKGKATKNESMQQEPQDDVVVERPPPIEDGGPTCWWGGGKIHRSNNMKAWRVFKKARDRCDTAVKWHGDLEGSWQKALDLIVEANQ